MDIGVVVCIAAAALVIGVLIVLAVISARKERARREALRQWAVHAGWTYTERPRVDWLSRLPGRERKQVLLALSGVVDGYPVTVADYAYTTTSTSTTSHGDGSTSSSSSTTTHRYVVVVIRLGRAGPAVEVQPRHALSKLGRTLFGDKPTAIGWDAFDRAFRVVGKDPVAARQLVGPRLAAEHVAGRVPSWSLYGDQLLTYNEGRIREPAAVPGLAAPLIRVARLLGT